MASRFSTQSFDLQPWILNRKTEMEVESFVHFPFSAPHPRKIFKRRRNDSGDLSFVFHHALTILHTKIWITPLENWAAKSRSGAFRSSASNILILVLLLCAPYLEIDNEWGEREGIDCFPEFKEMSFQISSPAINTVRGSKHTWAWPSSPLCIVITRHGVQSKRRK